MGLSFDFSATALMDGLKIMGFGMAGIFVVLAVIFITIWILSKMFPVKEKKK